MSWLSKNFDFRWQNPIRKSDWKMNNTMSEKLFTRTMTAFLSVCVLFFWLIPSIAVIGHESGSVIERAIVGWVTYVIAALLTVVIIPLLITMNDYEFLPGRDKWLIWRYFMGTRVRYRSETELISIFNVEMNFWLAHHTHPWLFYIDEDGRHLVFLSKRTAMMFKLSNIIS